MTAARRILILAPHPDDEIVACAIAARRARAAGASVAVLHLTTGVPRDIPWVRLGAYRARVARRRDEAEQALALMGFESAGFLDVPARQLAAHLDTAAAAIADTLRAADANAIWVPAFEGAHQDHDAASLLAAVVCPGRQVREFAAYNHAGGTVHSNRFADVRGGETLLTLTADEAALKRQALALYRSERGNLGHIRAVAEAWRPLPAHDYAAPPHRGTLFRERFHWLPFRHPRVDFAPSAELYRRLGQWAAGRALDIAPSAASDDPGQREGRR